MENRTRVLVVGGGSIGERHVRCFLATGRVEMSVCDTSSAVLEHLTATYPIASTHDSFDQAITDHFDLAVVATPAQLHVPMARRLVDSGSHVLIEKPLGTSIDGIDELRELAERRNRLVAVAYVSRQNPGLAAMREAILSGDWGPALEIVFQGGQDFPSFRPAYREIYYRDHRTGGGAIQDALTHTINAAQWIVGPVTEVAADAAHLVLDGVEVEDTIHVLARHGDVLASYSLNQYQPPNESYLQVNCRDASFRWEPHANRWRRMARGQSEWDDFPYNWPARDTGFITQADCMLDTIAGRRPVMCSLDEATDTLRCCLAILESANSRQWVTIVTSSNI